MDVLKLVKEASEKGYEAFYNKKAELAGSPARWAVQQHKDVLDDNSEVVKSWELRELCGFVWLNLKGNQKFVREFKKLAKKTGNNSYELGGVCLSKSSYYGGFSLYADNISGQGIESKSAGYQALQDVLYKNGVECSFYSRLD